MNESDFQTKFTRYLKYRGETGAYELKLAKGKSLAFSSVADHQYESLQCAKLYTLVHKISDEGLSRKPFDCFCLKKTPAYIVVMYYSIGIKHFYMIDINDFIKEKMICRRKSLTEKRAGEIGVKCWLGDEK
jgi:predicted nucleic acid-binding Zn ribbon protein